MRYYYRPCHYKYVGIKCRLYMPNKLRFLLNIRRDSRLSSPCTWTTAGDCDSKKLLIICICDNSSGADDFYKTDEESVLRIIFHMRCEHFILARTSSTGYLIDSIGSFQDTFPYFEPSIRLHIRLDNVKTEEREWGNSRYIQFESSNRTGEYPSMITFLLSSIWNTFYE